jgi:hypothetical protein
MSRVREAYRERVGLEMDWGWKKGEIPGGDTSIMMDEYHDG